MLALFLCQTGCFTSSYLLQAGEGQLDLMCRRTAITRAASDPKTPPDVRALLSEVPKVKAFALEHGLTPTGSYDTYVALDRPRVVWVTTASAPLAFEARTWRFPIVGSVPYLGWFDATDAEAYADELRAQGLDVDVRGATAYSTLGWFSDPILSSMLNRGPGGLAALVDVVLHESAHATRYIPGQSAFNESMAEAVADRLSGVYLRSHGLIAELWAYQQNQAAWEKRRTRMHEARRALEELYASSRSREEKLAEKARILEELRAELGIRRQINNATLLESRTYSSEAGAFAALWDRCGTWPRFWAAMRAIEPSWFPQEQATAFAGVLERATAVACPIQK